MSAGKCNLLCLIKSSWNSTTTTETVYPSDCWLSSVLFIPNHLIFFSYNCVYLCFGQPDIFSTVFLFVCVRECLYALFPGGKVSASECRTQKWGLNWHLVSTGRRPLLFCFVATATPQTQIRVTLLSNTQHIMGYSSITKNVPRFCYTFAQGRVSWICHWVGVTITTEFIRSHWWS